MSDKHSKEKDAEKHSRKSKSLKLNETPVKSRKSIFSFFTGKKTLEKKDSTEKIKISGPTGFQRVVHGAVNKDGQAEGLDDLKKQVEKMQKEIENEITWKKIQETEKSSKKFTNLTLKFATDVEDHKGREFVSYLNQLAGNDPEVKVLKFERKTKGRSRVGVGGTRGLEYIAIAFKNNTRVTSVEFYDMDLTEHGMEEFCEILSDNVYVTKLNLGRNFIGRATNLLAKVLSQTESITELNLSENSIQYVDSTQFFESLQVNKTLKILDLSKNLFGCDGLEDILKNIEENTTLTSLNLEGNDFGLYGAYCVGKFLEENKSLKMLNLNKNNFQAEGMKFISVGLFSNETLEEIHLDDNDIKDEGFQYFIRKEKKLSGNMKTISFSKNSISKGNLVKKFLTNNCNVTNLDISENKIGKGLSLILENLKENKTLTSLNLNGNHIKKEGLKDLLSLLDENKILKNVECHNNQIELNKAEKYHFKNPEKTKILKFYIEEVAEKKEGTEEEK